jgi:23S rRNA (adenine2030-N6)-methyltransferase
MNYRHIYHAGNFADVIKHCVLISIIKSLQKKESPLFFMDTHAGIGRYDLTTEIAQKTCEYENGITKIYKLARQLSALKIYQNIINEINSQNNILRFYPGSPIIFQKIMRSQDYLVLSELHQDDYLTLKNNFYKNKQVAVHHLNGYQALKAFLPPTKYGRGLILIDPAFEEKNEFTQIITSLQTALKTFANGVYIIWHPIKDKDKSEIKKFYLNLKNIPAKNILTINFSISNSRLNLGLTSCGMVIINPPWQIENELKTIISFIHQALALDATAKYDIKLINCCKL